MKPDRLADMERGIDDLLRQAGSRRSVPDPVAWAEIVSRRPLDAWQKGVMVAEAPNLLLLTCRRAGKSEVCSLRAAYRARHLRRRVGIISPTLRQSSIIFRRCFQWLRADDRNVRFARRTLTELELPSGGAIVAFPGDRPDLAIRGDTLDDLIVDEASRVKDDLIVAASPATATSDAPSITYLSTPAGARGMFHRAWSEEDFWHKVAIRASECPRIRPEFLATERKRLGSLYRQEYECEFMVGPGGVFDPEAIADVFGRVAQLTHSDWVPIETTGVARAW